MIHQKINANAQYVPTDDLRTHKQVLVLRKDLGMTAGKMFAQTTGTTPSPSFWFAAAKAAENDEQLHAFRLAAFAAAHAAENDCYWAPLMSLLFAAAHAAENNSTLE